MRFNNIAVFLTRP